MPSIVTKEGKGAGAAIFFWQVRFFHFFVRQIGKILTTSPWPIPGLTDDLGIAVII